MKGDDNDSDSPTDLHQPYLTPGRSTIGGGGESIPEGRNESTRNKFQDMAVGGNALPGRNDAGSSPPTVGGAAEPSNEAEHQGRIGVSDEQEGARCEQAGKGQVSIWWREARWG